MATDAADGLLDLCPSPAPWPCRCTAEFVEELSKLQDRVPAVPADKAVSLIERDLGRPISQLFRSFERRPIAAASLGQVRVGGLHDPSYRWPGPELMAVWPRHGVVPEIAFSTPVGSLPALCRVHRAVP